MSPWQEDHHHLPQRYCHEDEGSQDGVSTVTEGPTSASVTVDKRPLLAIFYDSDKVVSIDDDDGIYLSPILSPDTTDHSCSLVPSHTS